MYSPLSSSSSSSAKWTYDVFLNFRGKDTRYSFTRHLREALTGAGINTFDDDNDLHRGDYIGKELDEAIQGSKISIIVFSRNFAESHWCLDELVKAMECRSSIRQMVLPVFFNVDPSDVRNQRGRFAEAFVTHQEQINSGTKNKLLWEYALEQDWPHEKRIVLDPKELLIRLRNSLKERVVLWKAALKQAADLAGFVVDRHEAKVIEEIVKVVLGKLNKTKLFVAPHVVGMSSHLNNVISKLVIDRDDIVRMVGIWGLGGIGKTTITKATYNEIFELFDGSSFVENVRETWQQPYFRVSLQDRLLSDTLYREIKINNIDRGKMVIKERLRRRRVLVIIDDVDHLDQLSAIVGMHDWFGPGSRIIITTRDKHVLETHKVDFIYQAEEMSVTNSLKLFSLHAFGRSSPSEGYFELSNSVVGYCGGLPLALQVLGSFLFGRKTQEWKDTLEKLRRIPHPEIQQKLKISYDSLTDETVKDIFLDISCFFIGEDRNYVQQILDGCDFYPEIGIKLLFERCLITINEQNKLTVHDLLRDMAREIVREKSPKNPGKWSRLWYHEDVLEVLGKHKGTKSMEGISLKLKRGNEEKSFETESFKKMRGLRLLQLNCVQLTGSYEHISKDLRWLCLEGFPLEFIPDNFYLEDLVTMELRYSNLRQVYGNNSKLLKKLTYLDLSHSHKLTHTPDFSVLPNLKKLILKDCTSLHELHHSSGDLDKLVLVTLEGCKNLENLPKSFYKSKSLETLILSGCSMIDHLDENLGELVSLTMLNLEGCKILKYLPKSLYKLKSLEILVLSGCSMIDHLDEDLGELVSLTTLLADNTGITKPPSTIVRLRNLDRLSICDFKESSSRDVFELFLSWTMPTKSANSFNLLLPSFQGFNFLKHLNLSHCNLGDYNIPKELWCLPFLTSFHE